MRIVRKNDGSTQINACVESLIFNPLMKTRIDLVYRFTIYSGEQGNHAS
jgi:hypothetical protein